MWGVERGDRVKIYVSEKAGQAALSGVQLYSSVRLLQVPF